MYAHPLNTKISEQTRVNTIVVLHSDRHMPFCVYTHTQHNINLFVFAVYPPNWATLKSPAAGQKTVGRVT